MGPGYGPDGMGKYIPLYQRIKHIAHSIRSITDSCNLSVFRHRLYLTI